MSASIATRVKLKIKKVASELSKTPAEREFDQNWPVIDSIEGWLPRDEAFWLFNAARSVPELTNLVEIGSYKGRSTCCLALGCRNTKKRVFAIDSFDGGPDLPKANSLPDFSGNLRRCGLANYVEPIVGLSTDVAKTWDKPVNFLFIDGSHAYEDVLADFAGFFPHVVSGGMVAFHDVKNENWPGVNRAWKAKIERQLIRVDYCGTIGYGYKPKIG